MPLTRKRASYKLADESESIQTVSDLGDAAELPGVKVMKTFSLFSFILASVHCCKRELGRKLNEISIRIAMQFDL